MGDAAAVAAAAAAAQQQQRLAALSGAGASAEQAAEMVMALYHDPSRAAQANAWLVEMQASEAAWQLAPQLMQAAAEEVRFYGASTLYKKCRTDIAQVPAEARAPLLGQLLSMAAGAAAGPVRRHLCLAVAATVVAASEAVGGLAGLLGHAGFAALPKVAMLEILSFLPAEVNDSTLSSRQRDAIVVTLKEALPTVFGFVTAEAAAEDEATLAQVVAVVEGWAAQGTGLSLPLIATSAAPIYTLLFRLVQADSPLASSATAALCSAIEATTREQLAPARLLRGDRRRRAGLPPAVRQGRSGAGRRCLRRVRAAGRSACRARAADDTEGWRRCGRRGLAARPA